MNLKTRVTAAWTRREKMLRKGAQVRPFVLIPIRPDESQDARDARLDKKKEDSRKRIACENVAERNTRLTKKRENTTTSREPAYQIARLSEENTQDEAGTSGAISRLHLI